MNFKRISTGLNFREYYKVKAKTVLERKEINGKMVVKGAEILP